jgi:hypothetical protein
MSDNLTDEIYQLILKHYPNISNYHAVDSIKEMVEYFSRLNEVDEGDAILFWLTYRESTRVIDLNWIRDSIKRDILENNIVIEYDEDKEKSDLERGVLAAIRLIEHRVHCICD